MTNLRTLQVLFRPHNDRYGSYEIFHEHVASLAVPEVQDWVCDATELPLHNRHTRRVRWMLQRAAWGW
jgi:hypothetical protein